MLDGPRKLRPNSSGTMLQTQLPCFEPSSKCDKADVVLVTPRWDQAKEHLCPWEPLMQHA